MAIKLVTDKCFIAITLKKNFKLNSKFRVFLPQCRIKKTINNKSILILDSITASRILFFLEKVLIISFKFYNEDFKH
jgi:hypothetical protein